MPSLLTSKSTKLFRLCGMTVLILIISACASRQFDVHPDNLARIEKLYVEVFDLENKCPDIDIKKIEENMERLNRGEDAGNAPFWTVSQSSLLLALEGNPVTASERRDFRVYLIKKYGIVAPMIRLSKRPTVELYVSPTDKYALTPNEIKSSLAEKAKFSKLAKYLLENSAALE